MMPDLSAAGEHGHMRFGGWQVCVVGISAAVLVPWTVVLSLTRPDVAPAQHWSLAWTGLDIVIAAGLAVTAWCAYRRDPRTVLPATATAAVMVVDSWFDICTSTAGTDLSLAIAEALLCELPVAAVCLSLALRSPDWSGSIPLRLGDGGREGR
jgi:hypothetical protein